MVYSDDDGLTWKAGQNVPVRADWGSQNFNEPGIVELDNGKFWMYGRTIMGFHAQSWSADRGMTWSRPEPMVLARSLLAADRRSDSRDGLHRRRWAGQAISCSRSRITISSVIRVSTSTRPARRWTAPSRATTRRRGLRADDRGRPDRAVRLHEHDVSGRQGRRHAGAADDARAADPHRGPPPARLEVPVDDDNQ